MRKALGLPDFIIYIEPYYKNPFSAYAVDVEGEKKYFFRLWLDILEHLIECDNCCKDLGISKDALKAEITFLEGWMGVIYSRALEMRRGS